MVRESSSLTSYDSTMSTTTSSQKNIKFFYDYYAELCQKFNLKSILKLNNQKALSKVVLNITTDRLTFEEWLPIIQALFYDSSLHLIEIKAHRIIFEILDYFDSQTKIKLYITDKVNLQNRGQQKFNFLQTKFILDHLIDALSNCVLQSDILSYLSLNGVVLNMVHLDKLLSSIESSNRLQHLFLERCNIGDNGCELIYQRLRNVPSLLTINVSNCNITKTGLEYLVNLIKFQKNYRFSEIWKISLRNRQANINEMQGLRRLSINNNPEIGDEGAELLVDVLLDDLWIKAIDLQNCGLTNQLETSVRKLLSINLNIEVFDLRQNRKMATKVSNEFCMLLKQHVRRNTQFQWVSPAVSEDTKENSTSLTQLKATNSNTNVVPFKLKYVNENLELLNAKRTISNLQQQLKREQSRNERLNLAKNFNQIKNGKKKSSPEDEFDVVIDIRELTNFLKDFSAFMPVTETDSYLCETIKNLYEKLRVLIFKSVNDKKITKIYFDEGAFMWLPIQFQNGKSVEKNVEETIFGSERNEPTEKCYSNFISCNSQNGESKIEPVDRESLVIQELFNSFSTV